MSSFAVDRRRSVALILGLMLCLVLLGRWAMRPGGQDDAPADRAAAIPQSTLNAPSTAAPAVSAETTASAASDGKVNTDATGSGIFRGRIIDAVSHQPVRDFDLEFHPARHKRNGPAPPFHSFKTKDGRFECRGVPAGVWTVLATARGYQRFELTDLTIANGEAAREVLIPMRPGHVLHGRVYDDSTAAGIAAAQISFREAHVDRFEGNFRSRPSTASRQDGAFVLNGLPEGPVVVTVSAKNYARRDLEVTIGNKMSPVAIGLSTGGTIAGYLAGSDGLTPVAGTISLINLDEDISSTRRTGPAGDFNFRQLSPARYSLSGSATGLSGDREITISHNEQLEGIVLAMRGGHGIRGVVSGLRPEELESTTVSIYREGGYAVPADDSVDERGGYVITGVLPGRVRVSADVFSRRQIAKTVEMPADTDLTVNLEFPRSARLTGRVTRGGKALTGVAVHPNAVASPDQQELYLYEVRSSATGEYVIEDVPLGEYRLRVGSYRSPIVRISGDTVFDIDVPTAQLAGQLIEDGGNVPVVGAIVDVRSAQPGAARRVWLSDTSDHFGQFALRGMQPGDFVLSVYKPGYEMYRGPLAYGATISDLVIALRPARGVEIEVRDAASGTAVRTMSVQEIFNGQPGLFLQLNLDQNGVGYLPSAIAGSTLRFLTMGYAPITIAAWNGEGLKLDLQRQSSP